MLDDNNLGFNVVPAMTAEGEEPCAFCVHDRTSNARLDEVPLVQTLVIVMALFTSAQRRRAEELARLAYSNPFSSHRVELEKRILGAKYQPGGQIWSIEQAPDSDVKNLPLLSSIASDLVRSAQAKLREQKSPDPAEKSLYIAIALYHLFDKYRDRISATAQSKTDGSQQNVVDYWTKFAADFNSLFLAHFQPSELGFDASHSLAVFYQVRRAFFHVFYFLVGRSTVAARLRATVWESIFTHDLRRYQQGLYRHMADMSTLITGRSGTGKELVARAIGYSRYIPFLPNEQCFADDFAGGFFAVNLSALSPTLIESELFGHRRGAFTGALGDRTGWLEACPEHGSVFLDEIGELDAELQVKLLRVLQNRIFQRLGETEDRRFRGKVLSATNRDLATQMRNGALREDLYYRLCSDRIETPSLREQLDERGDDLRHLLTFIARRIVGDDADLLAEQVGAWIDGHLGSNYTWPGNVRELEQCFRSVVIHGDYQPAAAHGATAMRDDLTTAIDAMAQGRLTVDELLRHYCRLVYNQCGSYERAAQRLGLDRRTVKRRIEESN
jgi:transcriptional regulator with AAA-type ATPase domain